MTKKPEITFKLTRIEELSASDRSKIIGLNPNDSEGLVIKEYKSGSFVTLRRFIPLENLFTSQVNHELTSDNRKKISERIKEILTI